ncbi:RND family efflux transporter, MFP subunit [Porphyromonadaceae bacterium NLAE-zl-C104]|uniref:efflux RND transporter periplasmic adaptor subunit n=1 Tax=Proteiniphilum sp. TaxID=1926877 RepID=UPI00089A7002|nr:efflux RND transporter periplasmic adaptor subunit [Proteiniphilum sp.]MDY9918258.1 efflux RND transporter periplasmic adaptor subunit [Proteiniphilum sp.]SEA44961.1 RND family efflux transporter, MFP subunit [Porphyromonadaceae bacterium KH3R12]SFL02646.1 RND family efflux transporter, MFP subunit [Porphyromonadaceae bacterium KH3CP3RA]SFS89970.1 RND family efflux transporter, MFP subunit [Porphyromonadaceae bacterium NLAE-zl-C104]
MKYRILLSVIIIALLTACGNQTQSSQSDIETPVSVQELKKGSISRLINTTGTAQATYSVELNAEMNGFYNLQTNPSTGRPYKLGDAVKKGQLIIRLENKEYENGIALESKKLSLEIAEQEQSKQKALHEKGGVTLSEMRNTEVRVTNARYDLENATINLEKMNVRAPFDGIIVSLPHYTQQGQVTQGSLMVGLMAYTRMYMDINLPESAIGYVKSNQPVHITHYTLPDDTLRGEISELSPAISTETRTFKGKILIDNDRLKLRPGMFVKADIVVDQADSAIIIPKDVVLSRRNRKYVYIVERNTAILRDIQTGLEDEDNVEVIEGLKENDNLIIRGYETLRENSRVKVLK